MEKDPLTDALRYHLFLATPIRSLQPPHKKNRYVCLLTFYFEPLFFFLGKRKRLDNKLQRVRVGAQLCLTCAGGSRCACFYFFSPPIFFFYLRDVEASCWLLRAGNGLFLRGVWRRTTPLSFGGKQAMCIPLFLSSACFIFASACVPATNRTLSSVFASLDS